MSRYAKIIVTNRLVMGISVVYCTFLIVQFLLVKKIKFKKVLCSFQYHSLDLKFGNDVDLLSSFLSAPRMIVHCSKKEVF